MDISTFMMFFGVAGSARPVTQTFTTSGTFVVPANVISVDLSGSGARGQDARTEINESYTSSEIITIYPWNGSAPYTISGGSGGGQGSAPSNYCDGYVPPSGQENGYQVCYYFSGSTSSYSVPATTGASATAFGKTFPGSTGSAAPPTTSFTAVPVTAGSYNIVVPTGGSITINYYG